MIEVVKNIAYHIAEKQRLMIDSSDYIVNGILFCGKCRTPKQHKHIFPNGREIIHSCLCSCRLAEAQKKRQYEEQKKTLERIERMKLESVQEKNVLNWRFSNNDGSNKKLIIAKRYCENWLKMFNENIGLLLYGDVGTGKTYFAGCIANELLDKKIPVLMTNFTKLINQLSGFGDEKNTVLNDLNHYKLLIIDDLGVERQSEYVLEQVYNIIDSRYKNGQPMIITTNIPIGEIKSPKNMSYKRIYDRILQNCIPIEINGSSRREAVAKEKLKKAKEILLSN